MNQTISVLDRLTLKPIITIWILTIIAFSLAFYGLAQTPQLTYHNLPLGKNVQAFGNSVYFSFITALTIGYGGIEPTGIAKPLVILEAILSVALFGLIISALVKTKQDAVIHEVQELNYEEQVNTTISKLYQFRNGLPEETDKKSQKKSYKQKLEEPTENLREALQTYNTTKQLESTNISPMHLSLLINSLNFSLSRFVELLKKSNSKKIVWTKESRAATISNCQETIKILYEQYNAMKTRTEVNVAEKLEDLNKTFTAMQESLLTT